DNLLVEVGVGSNKSSLPSNSTLNCHRELNRLWMSCSFGFVAVVELLSRLGTACVGFICRACMFKRVMEMRDRLVLAEKIERLKHELFDYQYNMGVLILERNDLSSKCEELTQVVAEADEILKRQQVVNVVTFGEAEMRVENLRRALDHGRKPVLDLEKALQEMYEDFEKLKASSVREIAEAEAKKGEMEAKGWEVEENLQSASRKHAEADSKLSQLERQTQELEARENILKSEQLSLAVEREAHEDTFRKQKEGLMEWERKLQQVEERHCKQRMKMSCRWIFSSVIQ
ncbi:hypothetical protein Droror1_Dr00027064, partial [Drosera rotundifolia]